MRPQHLYRKLIWQFHTIVLSFTDLIRVVDCSETGTSWKICTWASKTSEGIVIDTKDACTGKDIEIEVMESRVLKVSIRVIDGNEVHKERQNGIQHLALRSFRRQRIFVLFSKWITIMYGIIEKDVSIICVPRKTIITIRWRGLKIECYQFFQSVMLSDFRHEFESFEIKSSSSIFRDF